MSFVAVANDASQNVLSGRVTYAAAALILYDYLITLKQEVHTVWRRRFTMVSVLVVTTRWALLVQAAVALYPASPSSCVTLFWTSFVCALLGSVQTAVFSALRLCAVWDRNYCLFGVVFILSLMPLVQDIYSFIHVTIEYTPSASRSCLEVLRSTANINKSLMFFSRSSLIIADLLVVVLSWVKTHRQYSQARALQMKTPVVGCLLRGGITYFLALLVLSVFEMLSSHNRALSAIAAVTVYTLPPILMYRFLMGLRLAAEAEDTTFSTLSLSLHHLPPGASVSGAALSLIFADTNEPLDLEEEELGTSTNLSFVSTSSSVTAGA